MPARPGAAASSAARLRRDRDERSESLDASRTDARDSAEIVDGGERTVALARGHDAIGEDGTDAGQAHQVLHGRPVQIDRGGVRRKRAASFERGSTRRGWVADVRCPATGGTGSGDAPVDEGGAAAFTAAGSTRWSNASSC